MSNYWVSSQEMADHLGCHKQTLLGIRRHSSASPFREGIDYRWVGLTKNGHLQWHIEHTEIAFSKFERLDNHRPTQKSKRDTEKSHT